MAWPIHADPTTTRPINKSNIFPCVLIRPDFLTDSLETNRIWVTHSYSARTLKSISLILSLLPHPTHALLNKPTSVTRFGKILPLWNFFEKSKAIFKIII